MQSIGQSAGKSFAYLVGVYLGDGCITKYEKKYPAFRLNTIDRDFAENVRTALYACGASSVSLSTHAVKKSKNPNHALSSFAKALTTELPMITDGKQCLPDMLEWSREMKLAFVAGLMDSEGFVGANSNPTNRRYYIGYKSCDVWVPDFIKLLEGLGIRIGKVQREKPQREGYKVPMRFTIKMRSWIDAGAYFTIARKQRRIEEWMAAGPYERRAKNPRRLTSETIRSAVARPMIESGPI